MKRFKTLLVLSLVLTLGAAVANAAKGAKPANPNKAAKKDAKGVMGTVVKVDGANIVVQPRGKKAAEVTIATDASTKFDVNGKPGTIDDVKAGANVQATPATGTAQKITVKGAKGDKAAKGAKKAAKNAA
jgi:hypothetical protein